VSEEGSVKYLCERVEAAPVHFPEFDELNRCRRWLREMGLIGVYPNGIGYGNISARCGDSSEFWISGSGTGSISDLLPGHYAKVAAFDFARNWVKCEGPVQASSESMTHAAIYSADRTARVVIHIHDRFLWTMLLDRAPTTSACVAYGTPEMALEIGRLFRGRAVRRYRIITMAGHEDGILTFGEDVAGAMDPLLNHGVRRINVPE